MKLINSRPTTLLSIPCFASLLLIFVFAPRSPVSEPLAVRNVR